MSVEFCWLVQGNSFPLQPKIKGNPIFWHKNSGITLKYKYCAEYGSIKGKLSQKIHLQGAPQKNDATFNWYFFFDYDLNWYAFKIYYTGN